MWTWWLAQARDIQIFYAIGLFSLGILVVQMGLMLIGVGHVGDDAGDVGGAHGHGHEGGMNLLSTRTAVAFGVGFGWAGAAALEGGLGLPLALVLALAAGIALMFVVFGLIRSMLRLRADGTLDYRNAVGQVGTVYMAVPAGGKGAGQIEVIIQGRLVIAQAYTRAGEALATRTKVKVVDLVDRTTLMVEPLA
jgi:hypothetical protein